ncbi:MAG: Ig domain-containing protein, partial [Eubacteriales bacterium]|nr:Ig domain-containing protein [Eubacteriales bacterium]
LTGSTVAASGSLVNGLPFALVIQRMVDAGIAAQIDENNALTQGGWTGFPANNNQVISAANPLISAGWIHGLHTAEEEMGADGVYINNRLKDRLANHLCQIQNADGGCIYAPLGADSIFAPAGDYLLACKWLGWDQWDAADETAAGCTSTAITKGEARQIYDRYLQYVIDHWETPYDSTKNANGSYLWTSGDFDSAVTQDCLSGAASSNLAARSLYGIRNFAEYEASPITSFGFNDWNRQFSVSLIKGQHASGYYKEAAGATLEQNALGLPGTTAYAAMAGGDLYPEAVSPVSVATAELTQATAGAGYSDQLAAAGGLTENYTWVISGLPAGLTYDSAAGAISGTPTLAGTYPLLVSVSDSISTASATLYLIVRPGALTITTDSLPDRIAGESNTYNLAAVGGVAPYSWQASGLPLGLNMDAVSGEITGIPIESGAFSI